MTTIAHASQAASSTSTATLLPDGPILVATDTQAESDAALLFAQSLATRGAVETIVISVIEPMTTPTYGVDGMVISMEPMMDTEAERTSAAHAQLLRMVPAHVAWPVVVKMGDPAREVATTAHDLHARLVVVGRGRHSAFDRLFGTESVLRMLQRSDAPVLAVTDTLTSAPRRVVIATDFSPFSLYAARIALTLAAPDAAVSLVHVGPSFDEKVPFQKQRAQLYRDQTATAFEQFRSQLHTDGMTVECVTLSGPASGQLQRHLTEQRADLVALATHGYGFLRRMVLGSVAASMIRHAPCSVLVVPGSAQTLASARTRARPNAQTRTLTSTALDSELAAFSVKNMGRMCQIEVLRDDFGAQVIGHDLPLVGVASDRHGNQISLMFGTSTLKGMHLTHQIPGAMEVDVTSNAGGQDEVLRIAHDGGQTLVSFT
jgi:nucleotide-binding universal stress UspA family protein